MNSDLEKLFEQAVCLAGTEREEFLTHHCADPELRQQLDELLAYDRGAETLLQGAVAREASSALQTVVLAPGMRLGPYRLGSVIGQGGMGLVYLAERADGKFQQRVAIKVLHAGLSEGALAPRMQQECRILARLEHANIARVLDADVTLNSLPYFVMEYVDGLPIDRYCEQHKLSIRDCMRLLLPICDAVGAAHRNLIVHRDLKPDNILVTAQGIPKLLDFGIAKVLSDVPVNLQNTATRVLTPEYASPEQARGEPVTTATDIYSLGGVLYKLLTGSAPHQLQGKNAIEAVRAICEEDVRKPSLVRGELAGEIDSILLKALHTDPQRRYRTVDQFVADLGRWLEGRPVLAVPPSLIYRARKFARRNRVALATVSAFALVLVAATVVSIREGLRANREAAVAEAVNEFLQNDLLAQAGPSAQSGPNTKPDPDLKVRTTIDRAAERVEGKFLQQPEVEAAIRDTIGWTYMDLGLYPQARKQLERALELRRRVLGAENVKTLKSMTRLGRVAALEGKSTQAEALFTQALAIQRRVLGAEAADTLYSLSSLANLYHDEGKYAQAEALGSQALDIERRVLGPEHPETLFTMNSLAIAYAEQGKSAQAEKLFSKVVEIRRRVRGPEHPDTLQSMGNLALTYYTEGNYAQAEALDSQTLEIERRVLGPEHLTTLAHMSNLALVYDSEARYAQAEGLYKETVAVERHVLGSEHPYTLGAMENLARVYGEESKYTQAEALFGSTLETERHTLGPEHPNSLDTLSEFAHMYQREGKYGLSASYGAQALAGLRHSLGSDNPDTMASAADLALAYISQGKFSQSEPLAREALAFNRKVQPDNWQRFRAESLLGASLAGQKKYAEAEPLLLEGYQGMAERKPRIEALNWYHLDRAREWLISLYKSWGKPQRRFEAPAP